MGDSRISFLVMLWLLAMVASFHAPPQGLSWAQWFTIQHVKMSYPRCDRAMRVVNGYRRYCKDKNTFLKVTYQDVIGVCNSPNITCHDGSQNCHRSSVQVRLTYCNLTRWYRNYTKCQYSQTRARMFYIVACENRSQVDPPQYPVVPAHLDGII